MIGLEKIQKKNLIKMVEIAKSGKVDDLILNQALDNFENKFDYKKSLDIKDFDISFVKGLI